MNMRVSAVSGQITPPREKFVQTSVREPAFRAPLTSTPVTGMPKRLRSLAAAGKFFEGAVVLMTAAAMPLIAEQLVSNRAQHGATGAASLFGILVGAIGLGGHYDFFGRKAARMIISGTCRLRARLAESFAE
jgi:hypothetical protein